MKLQHLPSRRRFLQQAGFAAALPATLAWSGSAYAAWPDRPISMIVPWGAGGATDAIARVVGFELERDLDRPINIVNRSGGGGIVGHTAIVNAAPDGYTLGMATLEITLYKFMGLANITPADFTPIARMGFVPGGISVSSTSPYKTIQELVTAIKKAPKGTFTASGVGVGGSWHINAGGWMRSIGLEPNYLRWVPSQGAAPAYQELMAGSIDIVTASPAEGRSLIEAGRVRPLALTHSERVDMFPNVPTLKEIYGTDWEMSSWMALVGPAGMPKDVTERLIASAKKAQESKAFSDFLKERGFIKVWEAGDDLAQYFNAFGTRMEPVLRGLDLLKT
ncbi:tripartite tricarboxylate transporter substrate binding protein [Pollutimonas sp. H1-120]|uniref:Bug family tripartite tricarboxylate transporter substrate binding protein n=1 Tax=Pollutimonas sp. H1-120 TaxID=3148824 RepID=UPI003B52443E